MYFTLGIFFDVFYTNISPKYIICVYFGLIFQRKIARKNALFNKTSNRIKFINISVEKLKQYKFDLIVSNPPYIARHQL